LISLIAVEAIVNFRAVADLTLRQPVVALFTWR
jgi:hypothetical protein